MAFYQKRPDLWKAEQWKGHDFDFDFDVKVARQERVSGYSAKLGYYKNHTNSVCTIRPNEYLLKSPDGKITSMPSAEFLNEFVLAKQSKMKDTKEKPLSNSDEDNAEVI